MGEKMMQPLAEAFRGFTEMLARVETNVGSLAADVIELKTAERKRNDFLAETTGPLLDFRRIRKGGLCFFGGCQVIVAHPDGFKGEYDHVDGTASNRSQSNCALVCKDHHTRKTNALKRGGDPEYLRDYHTFHAAAFREFEQWIATSDSGPHYKPSAKSGWDLTHPTSRPR